MKLQLTQQIIINNRHKYYAGLDYLCLLAKNLYNVALYNIRQQYFKDKTYLNYNNLDKLLSSTNNIDSIKLYRIDNQHNRYLEV